MLRDFFEQRLLRGLVRRHNNFRIARLARRIAESEQPSRGAPVVFFKASSGIDDLSWNSGFHLLASWAVRLDGVPVHYFGCSAGMSLCVLGTDHRDLRKPPPCRSCIHQSRTLYERADAEWFTYEPDPNLAAALKDRSLAELAQLEWSPEQSSVGARAVGGTLPLGALCMPSVRWILRRHHLVDDENTRHLLREYIQSAWNVGRKFAAWLDRLQPRAVVLFNGQFFPEAVAGAVARRRRIPVITHEVGFRPASAFFTAGDATAYPITIPADFELSPAQGARLDSYLSRRFQGDFSMAGVRFWPHMRGLDDQLRAKGARFKQVVPVFTNVVFDTSQPHANTVFEDMFVWLDLTLEIARAHPDTLFVIRAHPDELRIRKASRETVEAWAEASAAIQEHNVVFVGPREGISSYELIQVSKFVMVYNSTIGLEASILGKPVLCAGRARYTGYETVFFPQTAGEFRRVAEQMLTSQSIEVPPEFRRNSRRFLYYQVFRTSLPFDDLLRPSVRSTHARLKPIQVASLRRGALPALDAILHGILEGGDFLRRESDDSRLEIDSHAN